MEAYLDIVVSMFQRLSVFITIFAIYWGFRFYKKKAIIVQIITGLFLGLMLLLIMASPWEFKEGIQLDTRTVYMLLTGLFFGFVPTVVASVIGIAFRIIIGGPGMFIGSLTIIISSAIGIAWPKVRDKLIKSPNKYLEVYLLNLITHIFVLLAFLTVPNEGLALVKATGLVVIVFFPLIGSVMCFALYYFRNQFYQQELIAKQRAMIEYTINSLTDIEIYSVDKKFKYLFANDFHRKQMKRFYGVDIKRGDDYLDFIENETMKKRLELNILKAAKGEENRIIVEVEVERDKFLQETYLPMFDDDDELIGVTIHSEDITEQVNYQNKILELSYKDSLTKTFNRRYYFEQLQSLDNKASLPLSIVFVDINVLKLTNDALGHDAGDNLLKFVAERLVKNFSSIGPVMRIGGDEFAIFLPNTNKEEAEKLISNTQNDLKEPFIGGLSVSVSFGFETKRSKENINTVVKLAEDKMYKSKLNERRNYRKYFVEGIITTLENRHPSSTEHFNRVAEISYLIGKELNFNDHQLFRLKEASKLHDIGKIAVNEDILKKPGKLNSDEWLEVKRHPEIGYRILLAIPRYARIASIVLSHHERYDGTGYPNNLKDQDIPLKSKIISVADAYDAMTHDRPYKKKMTHEEALIEIKNNSGTQFDPEVVEVFLKVAKKL